MKAELVEAASEVITNQQILVNVVSRRVRQLSLGSRPLVECAPGLRAADIALTEIANGKLTFESTFGQNGTAESGPGRAVPGSHRRQEESGGEEKSGVIRRDACAAAHRGFSPCPSISRVPATENPRCLQRGFRDR